MISAPPQIPGYMQGLARHAGDSVCPGLRHRLRGHWATSPGPTGATLFDQSGHGNNGTLHDMDPDADWIVSPNGWVLNYDGTDARVDVPNVMDNSATPQTVAAWINPDTLGQASSILCANDAAGAVTLSCLFVPLGRIGLLVETSGMSLDAFTTNVLLSVQWQHVAWVWDGTLTAANILLYLNGRIMSHPGDQDGTGTATAATGAWAIGGRSEDDTVNFDGKIGDVAFWDRMLTSSEILALYTDPHILLREAEET